MNHSPSIWIGRQFTPLWCSQFLSALNDNLFRYGMIAALVFGVIKIPVAEGNQIVSLSAALFIFPYLIISGISGQLADKYSKATLLRWNRGLEIFIYGLSGYALITGLVPLLIISLLLTGALAAFYGPVKLAIAPELVPEDQLISANGAIESGTYAAILMGTLIGTAIITSKSTGPLFADILIIVIAVASWLFSLLTPSTPPAAPDLEIDWNVPKQTWDLVRWGATDRLRTILLVGNGWFWFVGTAVLGQLAIFVKDDLHSVPKLNTLLLALFACGIGLGAWLCSFFLNGHVTLRHASVTAFGMGFWTLVLAGLAFAHPPAPGLPLTVLQFVQHPWAWLMIASVVLLAANAGFFVVPMVTMMQTCVPDDQRARMFSLSNIWFAIFIIAGSLMATEITNLGGEPKAIFAVASVLSLFVSVYLYVLLPKITTAGFFTALLRVLYRVDVIGLENLQNAADSAVIVANHQSYLDGVLLGAFLPGNPIFAIDPIAASRWWAKHIVSLVDVVTLNPLQPMSVRHLIQSVQSGRHCVIFPEGRISQTGGLMKIYAGPAMIAGKSNAPIVPVRIEGVQFSPFSYMRGLLPIRWFPKVTIHILTPEIAPDTSSLAGRQRRSAMTRNLYDLMTRSAFSTQATAPSLWLALTNASKTFGPKTEVLEDAKRNPVSYYRLLASCHALGSQFEKLTRPNEHVGFLLPTGTVGVTTFFALQSIGRVPAMLNFTSGPAALLSALDTAGVKTVVTAHEFVEKAKLSKIVGGIGTRVQWIYLEDIAREITLFEKISAAIKSQTHHISQGAKLADSESTAVILFTSGSEGLPKGVALSHRNLLSNVEQVRTIVAYNSSDVVFNALPIFHAFGLTGGVLVPVLHGVKAFLHPTPLQYRVIPELLYHANATMFFGTDTFLAGYAKAADCYDLYKVRLIVAGAEPLRPSTQKLYAEKFGVPVFEGYGVTECSPSLALNTPMHHKSGTVGRLLPGISYRIVDVPGIETGGQLWVNGPNIMKGYYKSDQPGILLPLDDGWYDTGDIVTVDAEGFFKIVGRAKRFAKIAGEMISLTAVERYAMERWPDAQHAVINMPDARKGEALVLFTNAKDATVDLLAKSMRSKGAAEITIPQSIRFMNALPVLGSGKLDMMALKSHLLEPSSN